MVNRTIGMSSRVFELNLCFVLFFSPLFSRIGVCEDQDYSTQFNRLFTTAGERVLLDRIRREDVPEGFDLDSNIDPNKESAAVIKKRRLELHLQGVMLRHDGNHVVWINGRNTMSTAELQEGVTVDLRHILKEGPAIPIGTFTSDFAIKPGQVWLEDEDRIVESYGHSEFIRDDLSSLEGVESGGVKGKSVKGETGITDGNHKKKTGLSGLVNTFDRERRQKEIEAILEQGN
ncbi:MAG: hypothetical protein KUG82_12650 [Pseudomonadales bacterium]|nr:hypothetical protein [Pseudomonadales bacterium]